MTPELTFGGGYAGSLGNIGYGYDGACTCYYTDNADLAFNPGDVTQMRLSYASGPISFAIALEDASKDAGGDNLDADDTLNGDQLGGAGEIKYSGDAFSAEISGVWRGINEDSYDEYKGKNAGKDVTFAVTDGFPENLWQIGAGVGFALGDMANFSLAAATGEGPDLTVTDGELSSLTKLPFNNTWWGITALASFKLSDEFHAELAGGYKNREGDDLSLLFEEKNAAGTVTAYNKVDFSDIEYDTYGVQGGLYYTPVDQLTIGVEAEWYTVDLSYTAIQDTDAGTAGPNNKAEGSNNPDNFSIDFVSVWRF